MPYTTTAIEIAGLRLHAHIGVAPQEQTVGTEVELSLRIAAPMHGAIATDSVADTIDYGAAIAVAAAALAEPCALLEHAAGRVIDALGREFPTIEAIDLRLTKLHPPVRYQTAGATFACSWKR